MKVAILQVIGDGSMLWRCRIGNLLRMTQKYRTMFAFLIQVFLGLKKLSVYVLKILLIFKSSYYGWASDTIHTAEGLAKLPFVYDIKSTTDSNDDAIWLGYR